jgi:hypothetical protein
MGLIEELSIPIFFVGLGIAGLGLLWLIVTAFRRHFLWGVASLLPPFALLFALTHVRKARWSLAVLLLGGAVMAFPAVYSRLVPIDLGPREKLVAGELHITLTGWDRKDYSVLRARPDVVVLQMANPDVTDETLEYLKGLDKLRELDLNDTQVTDKGLRVLKDLPALESLRLKNTKVTDDGFGELAERASLRQLDLRGTQVSRQAVKAWRSARPGRRVLQ